MIDIIKPEDVRVGRGGNGSGVRYGRYLEAAKPIIPFLKSEIQKHDVIRLKTDDIAKEMGGDFVKKSKTSLYWGLKYSLFDEGIIINNATHKSGDKLLVMRARVAGDVLPESLAKIKNPVKDGKKDKDNKSVSTDAVDPTDISLEDIIGDSGEE